MFRPGFWGLESEFERSRPGTYDDIYEKLHAVTDARTRYKTIVQHVYKSLTFANPNIAFRENAIPKDGVIQIVF